MRRHIGYAFYKADCLYSFRFFREVRYSPPEWSCGQFTGKDYFIRNENAKNYIFKFHYVDPDLNNDYNQEDYIMETIYRGCSFSKASKPRSFRNFEDEGKKQ